MENAKNTIKGNIKVDTKYYATIVYPEHWVELRINPYWVLVRTKDEAILAAYERYEDIIHTAWALDISCKDVSFI